MKKIMIAAIAIMFSSPAFATGNGNGGTCPGGAVYKACMEAKQAQEQQQAQIQAQLQRQGQQQSSSNWNSNKNVANGGNAYSNSHATAGAISGTHNSINIEAAENAASSAASINGSGQHPCSLPFGITGQTFAGGGALMLPFADGECKARLENELARSYGVNIGIAHACIDPKLRHLGQALRSQGYCSSGRPAISSDEPYLGKTAGLSSRGTVLTRCERVGNRVLVRYRGGSASEANRLCAARLGL